MDSTKMRLLVIGATGGIGRALLAQGAARGHAMTAFVRSPRKLDGAPRDVAVVQGDPLDAAELAPAMAGHDAVLSALGPPGPGATTIHRDGARATIAAMETAGVARLVIMSAAILFDIDGLLYAVMRRTLLKNIVVDCGAMETIVTASDRNWTIVRPPRLTNGPLTRRYAAADARLPDGWRGSISRADVAHYVLDEAECRERSRRIVGLAATATTTRVSDAMRDSSARS